MKIELELFDLPVDKIKQSREHYIELLEDRFRYRLWAIVDTKIIIVDGEDEEEVEQTDVTRNYRGVFDRRDLKGIELYPSKDEEGKIAFWTVELTPIGCEAIEVRFLSGKDALNFYDLMEKYKFYELDLEESEI